MRQHLADRAPISDPQGIGLGLAQPGENLVQRRPHLLLSALEVEGAARGHARPSCDRPERPV